MISNNDNYGYEYFNTTNMSMLLFFKHKARKFLLVTCLCYSSTVMAEIAEVSDSQMATNQATSESTDQQTTPDQEHASESHHEHQHQHHHHDHKAHPKIDISELNPEAKVSLQVALDPMTGINLEVSTESFTLGPIKPKEIPEEDNTINEPETAKTLPTARDLDSEVVDTNNTLPELAPTSDDKPFQYGHGHLYINEVKVARLYGNHYHFGHSFFQPGLNTIAVTLNTDDHEQLAFGDKAVGDYVVINLSNPELIQNTEFNIQISTKTNEQMKLSASDINTKLTIDALELVDCQLDEARNETFNIRESITANSDYQLSLNRNLKSAYFCATRLLITLDNRNKDLFLSSFNVDGLKQAKDVEGFFQRLWVETKITNEQSILITSLHDYPVVNLAVALDLSDVIRKTNQQRDINMMKAVIMSELPKSVTAKVLDI